MSSGVATAPLSKTDPAATASSTPAPQAEKRRHAEILKATAMVGGSSFVNVAVAVVRSKTMAVLLGPAGVGLVGLYSSVGELSQTVAGMGVQSSGVRQIAEAVGTGDLTKVARTAAVLRRASVVLGLIGAVVLIACAKPISSLTFGTTEHTGGIALLSLGVLFRLASNGQSALIQGTRRIAELARQSVLAAVLGTCASVTLIYLFRERGIVPSLIAVWGAMLLASWIYSRRIAVNVPTITAAQAVAEAAALLKLGVAFMASGFLSMGAAYAIRIVVLRKSGLEAAGLYQAAWAIGGMYVGFVVQAMGADFYPRLTAVHSDNEQCTRLVNDQALISLLLAAPGVMATLTLAPAVMAIFYSGQFYGAVTLLRWICLGMTLRIIAWPMGYVILAKGARNVYLLTEIAAAVVHISLAWLFVHYFGVTGAGVAFFGLYIWHGIFVYAIVRQISGFRWSAANRRLLRLFLPLIGGVFVLASSANVFVTIPVGIVATVSCAVYSTRTLIELLPEDALPAFLRSKS